MLILTRLFKTRQKFIEFINKRNLRWLERDRFNRRFFLYLMYFFSKGIEYLLYELSLEILNSENESTLF